MALTSRQLALHIAGLAAEKKADGIRILDLRKLTSVTDFFVICTGTTDIHVRAISSHIAEELRKKRQRVWHVEGERQHEWVLLDYVDVVAHVFQPELRDFYNLERLWGDAKVVQFKDPAEPKKV